MSASVNSFHCTASAGDENRKATIAPSRNPFAQGIVWIEYSPIHLLGGRISLMDPGFHYCDLAYDLPAVWDGRFFLPMASCQSLRRMGSLQTMARLEQ